METSYYNFSYLLRVMVNAPYVRNGKMHKDLKIKLVTEEIEHGEYRAKLENHPKPKRYTKKIYLGYYAENILTTFFRNSIHSNYYADVLYVI